MAFSSVFLDDLSFFCHFLRQRNTPFHYIQQFVLLSLSFQLAHHQRDPGGVRNLKVHLWCFPVEWHGSFRCLCLVPKPCVFSIFYFLFSQPARRVLLFLPVGYLITSPGFDSDRPEPVFIAEAALLCQMDHPSHLLRVVLDGPDPAEGSSLGLFLSVNSGQLFHLGCIYRRSLLVARTKRNPEKHVCPQESNCLY